MKNSNNALDIFWQLVVRGPESFLKGKTATVIHVMYIVLGIGVIIYAVWRLFIYS